MPQKKSPFMYSINPELYARSQKPSSTVAMGMKSSNASALCWRVQVERENKTAERWRAAYDPSGAQEQGVTEALQRTLSRQAQRRADYLSPESNPEIHAILFRTKLYNSETPAQDADGADGGSTDNIRRMNDMFSSENAAALSKIRSIGFMGKPNRDHHGEKGKAAAARGRGADGQAANRLDDEASTQDTKKDSELYLEVRADLYAPPHRYPNGPATSMQVVGWRAEEMDTRSGTLYSTSKRSQMVGAYRHPEDEDHALLFGYDLVPK